MIGEITRRPVLPALASELFVPDHRLVVRLQAAKSASSIFYRFVHSVLTFYVFCSMNVILKSPLALRVRIKTTLIR